MNGASDFAQGWHTPVPDAHPAAALLSAAAVRRHCGEVFAQVAAGNSAHFIWHEERLAQAARVVAAVTRARYPDLNIPYHSRWRHFAAGGIDRWAMLSRRHRLEGDEAVRAMIDLTITSALLDAGAGNSWRYADREFGATLGRSEGLAAASIALFAAGVLSDHGGAPLRADAAALMRVREGHIIKFFQVDHIANPLTGVEGRAQLIRNLGVVAAATPAVFGRPARIGNLFDYLLGHSTNHQLRATFILDTLLRALGPLWPGRDVLDGVPLGDCWPHPAASGGRVPFHKLTQWLTYSLLDPLEAAGIHVTDLDELTGLPEYRNGGLFIDTGVIESRQPALFAGPMRVSDPAIVEWRALTVVGLDRLAPLVRAELGVDAAQFPLARVLEGGTWAAGRQLAQELRGGAPPIAIASDGTVF